MIINFENIFELILIGISISFIGSIGDLIESKFKRQYEVKDSGKILKSHGGMLYRLDSLIFVAPFVYLLYNFKIFIHLLSFTWFNYVIHINFKFIIFSIYNNYGIIKNI